MYIGSYLHDTSSRSLHKVDMQMYEIHNELITDLLSPDVSSPGGLELDETPDLGVHVKVKYIVSAVLFRHHFKGQVQ